jgi:hypothetical protein
MAVQTQVPETPLRKRPTVPPRPSVRPPQQDRVETEKLTRRFHKLFLHPLPERRRTNRFRQSHSDNAR